MIGGLKGESFIPKEYIEKLYKHDEIIAVAKEFAQSFQKWTPGTQIYE